MPVNPVEVINPDQSGAGTGTPGSIFNVKYVLKDISTSIPPFEVRKDTTAQNDNS